MWCIPQWLILERGGATAGGSTHLEQDARRGTHGLLPYPITILVSIPDSATHPFSIPPARQNPWLFLPCRSGRSNMPRFMPDPGAFVDRG